MKDILPQLGTTGLGCHPLAFGCYRVAYGNDVHEKALRQYLDSGGNIIDTSANYGDGYAEVLVGKVLADTPRDQVVVVTKGGYIQGRNMDLALQRDFPEVVRYGDGLWHCIHPEFLEAQIDLSRKRLQLDRIDVYLLHNPEYFLNERAHHGAIQEDDRIEFYRRVREAFRFLEDQVRVGTIRWYGISSNSFPLPQADPAHTSVARCLAEAQALDPNHRFRVVQLPLNLIESGAALEPNNDGKTALEFCREQGIGVLVNRPLNAFSSNRIVRLADFPKPDFELPGQQQVSDRVRQRLERSGYTAPGRTLSQMALHVVASLPGVSSVLCGMRRPEYVRDAMAVASFAPVDGVEILRQFAK